MRVLNDPINQPKFVNEDIKNYLSPQPTAEEMNTYFLEMVERNGLTLEEVNIVGHKFS